MTWLVWRRQRSALAVAAGLVVVTVVALVVARLVLTAQAAGLGVSGCLVDPGPDCVSGLAVTDLRNAWRWPGGLLRFWTWAVAPLIGLVVSATLFARETEERTVVFALTQSTTRARWWTANVAATVVAAMAGVVVVTLAAAWALAPFAVLHQQSRVEPLVYDLQGIWPFASALVSFAIAVLAGTLLRSSLAVVVVTVIGWVVVGAALLYTRYDLLPPAVLAVPVQEYAGGGVVDVDGMPGAFVFRDAAGAEVPLRTVGVDCEPSEDYAACLERTGIVTVELQYQPGSNFWPLQAIQAAIAVALSAVLLAGSHVRARRLG
ncbi:ABC transporter permease subunit [Pseudonocardia sp. WMMC193]|uniref:ABC transporter permease subunit n=1 Tax=Pseudonocardia sp. WMMC193 TaxID=2911965 RepID=UPI001EFFF492|nr:ABC transporter permease subunit [Pseudonocardia sp. WMMC193]MCF7548581.1 ABC transporter permease subunit [Pseudonocardia sp. WMMC193]